MEILRMVLVDIPRHGQQQVADYPPMAQHISPIITTGEAATRERAQAEYGSG